ncbi:UDP-N-acetylmuramoyl-L-alanyl-D-glutamate--2,6-diaminopimelate ligase [Marinicrinis lubricantis]|uniref:UDP-N-acetylmuramoyl-L-alanyl-D-glutamate--2,6-diaminopimelate ligase n=1 Tax=Marinicrinis lubricantis TaxID=2086470 RepID=A0ABW1IS89_9BACL
MKLKECAALFVASRCEGDPETEIQGLAADNRKVRPGDLFICIRGYQFDGHEFAADAVERGAAALVTEQKLALDIPQLIVKDTRYAMSVIAAHFYGYPSSELKVIGVTGTNGKTTITYLMERILEDQGKKLGLMGTIQTKIGGEVFESKNTTLESLDLQRNLRKMRDSGAEYAVMEVSSHALELGRVKGCDFKTAIFTNLTQDHLDFHETMENYRDAKSLFFSRLGNTFTPDVNRRKVAVLNADDPASKVFARVTSAQVITYGIDQEADVRATNIRITHQGTMFQVESFAGHASITLKLIGKFSVYNALAAIAAGLAEGFALEDIQTSLEKVSGVNGRFEAVMEGQPFLVVVDYAHTPDSLENVLATIKDFAKGNIISVFGCGGDRDRTKRPVMGEIAAKYSDYVFVTSDNPRTEDPSLILADIEPGVVRGGLSPEQYSMIVDRKEAIEAAIEMASHEDVVLIAGKGHETYQEVNGIRTDFDDRIVAKHAIRRRFH